MNDIVTGLALAFGVASITAAITMRVTATIRGRRAGRRSVAAVEIQAPLDEQAAEDWLTCEAIAALPTHQARSRR